MKSGFEIGKIWRAVSENKTRSRRDHCHDNPVAESFFDTLKVELVHRYKLANRSVAQPLLIDYIAAFYNNNRTYSRLGFFSPAEYEKLLAARLRKSVSTKSGDDQLPEVVLG